MVDDSGVASSLVPKTEGELLGEGDFTGLGEGELLGAGLGDFCGDGAGVGLGFGVGAGWSHDVSSFGLGDVKTVQVLWPSGFLPVDCPRAWLGTVSEKYSISSFSCPAESNSRILSPPLLSLLEKVNLRKLLGQTYPFSAILLESVLSLISQPSISAFESVVL